jgi:hypothetical protein
MALFFHMPGSITEQALIDACTVVQDMPIPLAPEASFIVLVRAMFLPIHEVIEFCVKHCPRDVQGH